ncbi:hypothetical protein MXB_2793 [Myxobolus squamalis]|nr:hypothetical protein MXB_2793 [Myxobolus squamalis]
MDSFKEYKNGEDENLTSALLLIEDEEYSNDDKLYDESKKNELHKFTTKIPKRFHLYLVIFFTITLNIVTGSIPVLLRKYGIDNKIDITFLTFLRIVIPAILNFITASFLEGKFHVFSTVNAFGIITNGFSPFVGNYVAPDIIYVFNYISYLKLYRVLPAYGTKEKIDTDDFFKLYFMDITVTKIKIYTFYYKASILHKFFYPNFLSFVVTKMHKVNSLVAYPHQKHSTSSRTRNAKSLGH